MPSSDTSGARTALEWSTMRLMLTISDVYSEAHPYYEGEDEVTTVDDGTVAQESVPAKEVPAAADMNSTAEILMNNDYVQKSVLFFVVLAVVITVAKRVKQPPRSPYMEAKSDEKSMA